MYPRRHFSRVAGLHGADDLLGRLDYDEVRDAADLAESRSIFIDVDVAFVDGEVGEFFQDEIPVDALTCATPVGGEINEGRDLCCLTLGII